MMETFISKFPEIARNETRSATLQEDFHGVKAGEYYFFEMFCSDNGCDCRRAMIRVCNSDGDFFATLSYGWEKPEFYTDWMFGDEEAGEMLSGVHLYDMAPQTEHSDFFLTLFENMLNDTSYANRIKSHYELFKGKNRKSLLAAPKKSPFGKNFFNKNVPLNTEY